MAGLLGGGGVTGTWKLFIDNYGHNTGAIDGGWSLTFTTGDVCTADQASSARRGSARCDWDWVLDFDIYQVGLQDSPPPSDIQLRTESVGNGTIRFEKKPARGVWEIGKVTTFELDQYDFAHSQPEAPVHIEFGLRAEGRKVQVQLGRHNERIAKLPFVITESQGLTTCPVGLEGTLTAVEHEFADGFRTGVHDPCTFYDRQFVPGTYSGGASTVTVVIGPLQKIEG
ncbi:MAG: hypothetical protein WD826_05560 [Actinomycetota bacterium]